MCSTHAAKPVEMAVGEVHNSPKTCLWTWREGSRVQCATGYNSSDSMRLGSTQELSKKIHILPRNLPWQPPIRFPSLGPVVAVLAYHALRSFDLCLVFYRYQAHLGGGDLI